MVELIDQLSRFMGKERKPLHSPGNEEYRSFTYFIDDVKNPSREFHKAALMLVGVPNKVDGVLIDSKKIFWSDNNPHHEALVKVAGLEKDEAGFQVSGSPKNVKLEIFIRTLNREDARRLVAFLKKGIKSTMDDLHIYIPSEEVDVWYKTGDDAKI